MRVVEGHAATEVTHISLGVEVRHTQRLHQGGMGMAELVPRDLDSQPRRNRIQDPVRDVLDHVVMTGFGAEHEVIDRKRTRLNSSHLGISYAVFCLKKK